MVMLTILGLLHEGYFEGPKVGIFNSLTYGCGGWRRYSRRIRLSSLFLIKKTNKDMCSLSVENVKIYF